MTVVFVHGVPETDEVWDGLRARLRGDSVALRLPGFGSPRPGGFTSTKDEYVSWLEGELRAFDGPVDLVGHDWGALLVARVASRGVVGLRSWAVDVASVLDRDYIWHDAARLWQTPGAGETWATESLEVSDPGSPLGVAGQLRAAGVTDEHARAMGKNFDETMASSILALYRSATPNPFAHWGADLTSVTSAPGLVLHPTHDPYDGGPASEVAAALGARFRPLEGLGHWWMLQDPGAGAAALEEFWAHPEH
ncbi:alpha/beta fold hydrolase [Streptomyces syringium]|uniref:alpha/beta fold hydrolase n=1 Tax=Streptomyces syringium TaxID=76729 RepID=UPI00364A7204